MNSSAVRARSALSAVMPAVEFVACACAADPELKAVHHCKDLGVFHPNQNPFCHDKVCGTCRVRICKQADTRGDVCPNTVCVRCGLVECAHCRESDAETLTGAVFVGELCAECDYAVREEVRQSKLADAD